VLSQSGKSSPLNQQAVSKAIHRGTEGRDKVLQTPFLPEVIPTHRQPVQCAYQVIITYKTGLFPGALIWVNAACVSELPHTALNEVETHFIKHSIHHLYLAIRRWTIIKRQGTVSTTHEAPLLVLIRLQCLNGSNSRACN
jgi:hypothetical protein